MEDTMECYNHQAQFSQSTERRRDEEQTVIKQTSNIKQPMQ